jgi:hypothetical protein
VHNLFNHVYPTLLTTGIMAASSTDHYTDCLDMRGYEGVAFIINSNTTGATAFTAYAQMSATSSGTGTFVDVYGSTVSHTTGFNVQAAVEVIDVFRPKYRWVRCYVDRGTTDESMSIMALQYRPISAPPSFSTAAGISDVNIVVGSSS